MMQNMTQDWHCMSVYDHAHNISHPFITLQKQLYIAAINLI